MKPRKKETEMKTSCERFESIQLDETVEKRNETTEVTTK